MINGKEIEIVAKKIQTDNPGMTFQTATKYAEKNIINRKKNQTILFIMPINYSYTLLNQIIKDSNVSLKIDKEFVEPDPSRKNLNGKNQKLQIKKKQEKDFCKSLNLFYSHPLGILYLAGVARACGFKVEILDLHKNFCEMIWNKKIKHESIQSFMYDKIKKKILLHNPVLVSISCLFSMASEVAHDVVAFVKKIDTNVKVLMGGGYPTNSPKETLSDHNVDAAIIGEGEDAFNEILCSLDKYSPENYFHNPAIATQQSLDKKIKPIGDKIKDLDNLPYPAWDLLDNPISYITGTNRTRSYDLKEKRCVSLYTSRGCPFYCTFCASHTVHGRKLRLHSLDHIFAEIDKLVKAYDINLLLLEDDIFNFNRKRTIDFCKGLIDRWGNRFEIEFPNGIYIPTLDDEVVGWLSRAGVKDVHIAVESGHQYTLTNIVKKGGLTLEKIKKAIDILNKYDIIIRNFFIIGFPGETKEMIRKSLQFAADLNSDWTSIFIASPIHGSDLYRIAHEEGYLDNSKNDKNKLENRHYLRSTLKTKDFTSEELEELQYDANLQINFINNRNLINKRYDRAEALYGDLIRIYPDHMFANYCYWQSLVGQNKLKDSKIIEDKLKVLLKNPINIKYVKKYNLFNKEPFSSFLSKYEIESANVETLVAPKWQLM